MAANDIFRFLSVRPPNPITRKGANNFFTIELPDSALRADLKADDMNLKKARQLADAFMDSKKYNPDARALRKLVDEATKKNTVAQAKTAFEDEIGPTLGDYLNGNARKELENNLWDSFLAHSYLQEKNEINYDNIYDGLRALEYFKLTNDRHENSRPISMAHFQKLKPLIPAEYVFKQEKDNTQSETLDEIRKKLHKDVKDLYNKLQYNKRIQDDLKNTGTKYDGVKNREVCLSNQINKANAADNFKSIGKQTLRDMSFNKGISAGLVANNNRSKIIYATGAIPATKPWIYEEFGQKNLGNNTKAFLKNNINRFQEKEDIEIRALISNDMNTEVRNFLQGVPKLFYADLVGMQEFRWIQKNIPLLFEIKPWTQLYPMYPTAYSRGIRPLGIGDLMVVKQELIKYTTGEVAHIENVLQGESKLRTHKRITETEESYTTEVELSEETERNLQSTERFELQKESQETIETDMKVSAGFNISASYGVVTASAHGDFAYGESSSESNKTASSFAKEVVDKSVSKIIQKSREERSRRTLERVEETNEHGINNAGGDGHVRGLYRWIDKHYKARVINYGKRLMFEFIIPEPAAFYIHTEADREQTGVTMKKPSEPKIWGRALKPSDLTKTNYVDFISEYNVQDVEPYPVEIVRVSASLADAPGAGGNSNVHFGNSDDTLKVPDGYKAISFSGYWHFGGYDDNYLAVFIGGTDFNNASVNGVEGIIPISVAGWGADYNVSINVKCELKDDGIEKWQLKTYQAIMNAYQNELSAYNEQVRASEISAGISIEGRNPGFNRKIERDELRKGALRIFTDNFDRTGVGSNWYDDEVFNAMSDYGDYGYPEFNVKEAQKEGRIIQFFEQAFEWNNMTYFFYPYFWGRKKDWDETFSKEDTDTTFTDFLRAGAARIVVPVHPSYNEAVLYYLKTNQIWNGGLPPTINDPLFISIIDEIKADTETDLGEDLPACDIDSGYPCIADEWDVVVPTNLVYLQEDATLPDNS